MVLSVSRFLSRVCLCLGFCQGFVCVKVFVKGLSLSRFCPYLSFSLLAIFLQKICLFIICSSPITGQRIENK